MSEATSGNGPAYRYAHAGYKFTSHAVAFEHLPARLAELRPIHLQTALNRAVITEILTAQTLGVAGAGLPLLW
jgi:hypothetical protein